jgi:hypothetical protein
MPRMTAQLFQEILDAADSDIETLEIEKQMTEGEDVPTEEECAAIERVQAVLRNATVAIKAEVAGLAK